jgi:hypothetical protein
MTLNLAFYTCFYGAEDNPAFKIPPIPSTLYPCFYYTNNKKMIEMIEDTEWTGIYDDKPTVDLIDSCMAGKHVKTMPHRYKELKDFDYTCFLDSKLGQINIAFVLQFIETYFIRNNYALLLREHWYLGGNIWHEYFESMKYPRYLPYSKTYIQYIESQLDAGLEETHPHHSAGGFLIRNMKHPETIRLNETWFQHIQQCGLNDQISFFFVKQLFPVDCILSFKEYPYLS